MEIKFKLDDDKALKAAVTIAASCGICCVSSDTEYPQPAAVNAVNGLCPVSKIKKA